MKKSTSGLSGPRITGGNESDIQPYLGRRLLAAAVGFHHSSDSFPSFEACEDAEGIGIPSAPIFYFSLPELPTSPITAT